ncbi:MAG: hypothetical protein IT267_12130 [Saprospiraceae bacterium]|nr:hypothetical protein [Saprospiraceae bacterium]
MINLIILMKRTFAKIKIILFSFSLLIVLSCSDNYTKILDPKSKKSFIEIKEELQAKNWLNVINDSFQISKNEWVHYSIDTQSMETRIKRLVREIANERTSLYFLRGNDLIYVKHVAINSAKIKHRIQIEMKEYFYTDKKCIFAIQKSRISKFNSLNEVEKLERKKSKLFQPSSKIYQDEVQIIERIKVRR